MAQPGQPEGLSDAGAPATGLDGPLGDATAAASKANADCIFYLASPLMCKKVRDFCSLALPSYRARRPPRRLSLSACRLCLPSSWNALPTDWLTGFFRSLSLPLRRGASHCSSSTYHTLASTPFVPWAYLWCTRAAGGQVRVPALRGSQDESTGVLLLAQPALPQAKLPFPPPCTAPRLPRSCCLHPSV